MILSSLEEKNSLWLPEFDVVMFIKEITNNDEKLQVKVAKYIFNQIAQKFNSLKNCH